MEPVFDKSGQVVAWLRGDHLIDPRGRHVAFLRNNWVLSYRGTYLGRLYSAWFRDLAGAAVGFVRGAPGLPAAPATGDPPPPPNPELPPVPPLVPLPPSATRPMPIWSRTSWQQFVGCGSWADDQPPRAPARDAGEPASAVFRRVRSENSGCDPLASPPVDPPRGDNPEQP